MKKLLLMISVIIALSFQSNKLFAQIVTPFWGLTGNASTVDGTHFIGTTDNVPFNIRVNNQKAGRIDHLLANTFFGYRAGFSNTTGIANTAIGLEALINNTTGNYNTANGSEALKINTTGSYNTTFGYKADVGANNLTNATAIGANAVVSASNSLVLGNNANVGIGTSTPGAKLEVAGQVKITGGSPGANKVLTSDATGLAVWQTPTAASVSAWGLTGNINTVDGTNFIGTTDNVPFNIRVNNQESGKIDHLKSNTFFGYRSGFSNTIGGYNTAIGDGASYSNTTGAMNTALGVFSLHYNTTGDENVGIGSNALPGNTIGNKNVAIGVTALLLSENTNENTAVGYGAMNVLEVGDNNTAVGSFAYRSGTGNNNTAIGADSYSNYGGGSNNTVLGYAASMGNHNLTNATAIGANAVVSASNSLVLGNNANVGIGTSTPGAKLEIAGQVKITGGSPGANKVLTSDAAGLAVWQTPTAASVSAWGLTGNAGTSDATNFIGTTDNVPFNIRVNNQKSGKIDPTLKNAFFGYRAGASNTSGYESTAIGHGALNSNTTGRLNTAVGFEAMYSCTEAYHNTAIGNGALYSNISGNQNTATGYNALYSSTTAFYNTATGTNALYATTTGNNNTATGYHSLQYNTTGYQNTATGAGTLKLNTTGYNNTGTGLQALNSNTTGYSNTATGLLAMQNNTEGYQNTADGVNALYNNTIGTNNTSVGYNALYGNTTGSSNTAIGYSSNVSTGALTNATAIGNGAIVNASNKIRLGNAAVTVVEGPVAYTVSDGRFKSNIEENDAKAVEFIKQLRPVAYNFDSEKFENFLIKNMPDSIKARHKTGADFKKSTSIRQTGFIAQEMEQAMKKSGYHFSGLHTPENESDNYSIAYGMLTVPLVKGVQELDKQNAEQQKLIETLEARVAELSELIKNSPAAKTTVVELSSANTIILNQNEPNPFAEQTSISYNIPDKVKQAQILFYDMSGRVIKTVEITERGAGALQVYASNLSSGIYTYSLITDGKLMDTKKMMKRE